MLVGHVYHLVTTHPHLDFVLVPNLCSEDGARNTCSKYRDAGGVAYRALAPTLAYLRENSREQARRAADDVLKAAGIAVPSGQRLPVLLQPYVWSLEREAMFNACFGVYCDVFGISAAARLGEQMIPPRLQRVLAPHRQRCLQPFATAYDAVMRRDDRFLKRFLAEQRAVRLAIVGREYLVDEPLLTADLKAWFMKAGARVITPADVWPEDLPPGPDAPWAFYETHWVFDAFVEMLAPHVDGFVFAGCFGCHPDAFILEFLLDRARSKGLPAWLFRYDEQVGSAGFQTRYETVMRFLEQHRDRRLATAAVPASAGNGHAADHLSARPVEPEAVNGQQETAMRRVPLIIWPHMSDTIDLIVQELAVQAGLTSLILPPRPVSDVTLDLAGDKYAESCCPYAFSTGSLMESLNAYFRSNLDGPPRRIVALTLRGEGPCTLGLYLIAQARDLPAAYRQILDRGGHTLEFVSVGLADVTTFVRELTAMGNRQRLAPIVDYMRLREEGTWSRLSASRRFAATRRLWRTISSLFAPGRAKLAAVEEIRARTLIARAHETTRGATQEVYRRSLARLAQAHTVEAIRGMRDAALAELAAVPQDHDLRPRVAVVGEMYIVQASYSNRGVVDNLLGRHGIEVVEGTTLGAVVHSAEREIHRRAWVRAWPIRPLLEAFWRRNIMLFHHQADEGKPARPFMNLGVGGEGNLSVAQARRLIEAGVDGVVHIYPFKCMPEAIAKPAMAEMCRLYGVPYLPLSFNRELEIERVKTEIATFAALLHARVGQAAAAGGGAHRGAKAHEVARRRAVGRAITDLHRAFKGGRFAVR